jgi:hypothetical protein
MSSARTSMIEATSPRPNAAYTSLTVCFAAGSDHSRLS